MDRNPISSFTDEENRDSREDPGCDDTPCPGLLTPRLWFGPDCCLHSWGLFWGTEGEGQTRELA